MLLISLLDVYSLVIFGTVIISWVQLPPDHPIASFLHTVTEPLLGPIRQVLPDMGGLDLSPMVLLLAVRLVRGALLSVATAF